MFYLQILPIVLALREEPDFGAPDFLHALNLIRSTKLNTCAFPPPEIGTLVTGVIPLSFSQLMALHSLNCQTPESLLFYF